MEAQGSRSLLISALITWPWHDQGGGVHAEWQTQETEAEAEREEESRNDVDLHQTCVSASCSPSNIQNNHVNITSHHSSLTKSLPLGGWANDWSCVPPTRVKIRSTRPTNIRLYISYNVIITPQSKTIRTYRCWWINGWNTKCITSALQTLPYLFQL